MELTSKSKFNIAVDGKLTEKEKMQIEKTLKKKGVSDINLNIMEKKEEFEEFTNLKKNLNIKDMGDLYIRYFKDNNIKDIDIDAFLDLDGQISSLINYDLPSKFRILNIKSKNILSFAEASYDISEMGLVKVFSDPANEGGKSNLVRLIKILLFGEFYRNGERSTLSSLLHKFSPLSFGYISGDVELDGERYSILREFEKNTKGDVSQKVVVKKDGLAVDSKEVFDRIGDIKNFLLLSYFDTFSVEKWLNTKPTERYRLFMKYFGLELLEQKCTLAKEKLKFLEKNFQSGKYTIAGLTEIIDKKEKNKQEISSQKESNNIEIEKCKKEIEDLENEIGKLKNMLNPIPDILYGYDENKIDSEIFALKDKISRLSNENSKLNSERPDVEMDVLKREKKALEDKNISLTVENDKKYPEIESLNYMRANYRGSEDLLVQIEEVELNIHQKREMYSALRVTKENIKEFVCPKCNSVLDVEKEKKKIDDELFILENEGKQLKDVLKNLKNDLQGDKAKYDAEIGGNISKIKKEILANIEEEKNKIKSKIYDIQEKIDAHNKYLNDISLIKNNNSLIDVYSEKIVALKEKKTLVESYADSVKFNLDINEKINVKKIELSEKRSALDNFNKSQYSFVVSFENLEKEILELDAIKNTIYAEEKIKNLYKFYIDIHNKGGISLVFLKELTNQINYVLANLFDIDFTPEIEIDEKRDTINFLFKRDNVRFDLNEGSGFQKTITSLALHYAILSNIEISPSNVLIMDETFIAVSSENMDKMLYLVQRFNEIFETIFIITHDINIANSLQADNQIKITKYNNNSIIE